MSISKDESQNMGRVQTIMDFICFGKDLDFYFKDDGKSLVGF